MLKTIINQQFCYSSFLVLCCFVLFCFAFIYFLFLFKHIANAFLFITDEIEINSNDDEGNSKKGGMMMIRGGR